MAISSRGYRANVSSAAAANVGIVVNDAGAVATAGPGDASTLHSYVCYNSHNATVFLQIFNLRAASVTLATTLPVLSIPLPPGTSGGLFEALKVVTPGAANGGLSYAVTATNVGNGAPGAAVEVNLTWS